MMGNTVKQVVIFAVGAGIGAVISWQVLKTKYARIAQEEIDSVKEVYLKKESKIKKILDDADDREEVVDEKAVNECSKIVTDLGYVSTNTREERKVEITLKDKPKPYVISPDEFDELDYDTETLTYYADKVLADDFDHPIEDVESLVGEESLTHFGEYEDDSVYVRNDQYKTDYEILLDIRTYKEATGSKPFSYDVYPGDDE